MNLVWNGRGRAMGLWAVVAEVNLGRLGRPYLAGMLLKQRIFMTRGPLPRVESASIVEQVSVVIFIFNFNSSVVKRRLYTRSHFDPTNQMQDCT